MIHEINYLKVFIMRMLELIWIKSPCDICRAGMEQSLKYPPILCLRMEQKLTSLSAYSFSPSLHTSYHLDHHWIHPYRVPCDFIRWLFNPLPQSHGCGEVLGHQLWWGCSHQKRWNQVNLQPPRNCWIEILFSFSFPFALDRIQPQLLGSWKHVISVVPYMLITQCIVQELWNVNVYRCIQP